ncbi:MAG TPA: TonB-dependent receptor [Allosphingosinicella sp.]|nr:TonB-dependent receptor [Allosphingosinicella sp.]
MTNYGLLRAGASILSLISGGAALAQDPSAATPPAAESATSDAGSAGVEEIIVTAQKRSERLQDVPVTVAAVSASTLAKAGVDSTAALTNLVPGLNLSASMAGFRPFVRGVGTVSTNAGNENSVSSYLDNVYLTSMNAGLLNLTSIEAVEVLKGPQGTLFGRNATGGVVNVRTKDPSHNLGGTVSASVDNFETIVGTGYVTGGLTDNIAADLAVYYRNQGQGYGKNLFSGRDVNKEDDITVRSKILITPSSVDKITLAADYSKVKSSGMNAYHPAKGTTVQWGPPDATHPAPRGAPYVYTGGGWDVDMATEPRAKMWNAGGSLTYDHEFPWATLRSISAYRKSRMRQQWNATPIPTNAQIAGWNQPERQFSQELQLNSLSSSRVKWILGFYYLDAFAKYDPFFISGTVLAPVRQEFRMKQSIKSPAVYGQVTMPIDALGDTNVTGGLRYTIDKRSIVGHIDVVSQATGALIATANPTDASKTFKTFTWRLSMDHHFTPDIMGYVSYNRGFKAGSYNSIPPGGPTAKPTNPEFLDAYEIGMKTKVLNGKVVFNWSAFYYNYKDLQVTIFNQTAATTVNAAAARIYGLDVDMTARVNEYLQLNLGAELLDHKYTDYPNGPILAIQTLAQGGGVVRTFGDVTGNALSYTSDAVVNGGLFFEYPTDIGKFDFNTTASWNSGYTFEPSEAYKQGSFVDWNATAGFELRNGTTRLSVFMKNILDEKIIRVLTTGGNPGGYIEEQFRPPRTYGVMLSQSF